MKNQKENSRDLQDAYMMVSAAYNQKQNNAIADRISAENLKEMNDVFSSVIPTLRNIREKLHGIEYKGGDHTVYFIPSVYHNIDELIKMVEDIKSKINKEKDTICIDEYLNTIKEFEKLNT
jgi:hypothetical protein